MLRRKSAPAGHGSTYRPLRVESRLLSAFAIGPVTKSVTPNQQKLKQMREVASKYNNLIARQQVKDNASEGTDHQHLRSIDGSNAAMHALRQDASNEVERRIAFSGGVN